MPFPPHYPLPDYGAVELPDPNIQTTQTLSKHILGPREVEAEQHFWAKDPVFRPPSTTAVRTPQDAGYLTDEEFEDAIMEGESAGPADTEQGFQRQLEHWSQAQGWNPNIDHLSIQEFLSHLKKVNQERQRRGLSVHEVPSDQTLSLLLTSNFLDKAKVIHGDSSLDGSAESEEENRFPLGTGLLEDPWKDDALPADRIRAGLEVLAPLNPRSTLRNGIMSVFGFRNFFRLTENGYRNLEPALQLASQFLGSPKTNDFFKWMVSCKLIKDDHGRLYLKRPQRIVPHSAARVGMIFKDLGGDIDYCFFETDETHGGATRPEGVVETLIESSEYSTLFRFGRRPRSWLTGLQRCFREFPQRNFGDLSWVKEWVQPGGREPREESVAMIYPWNDENRKLRFWFIVAVTLAHEYVHAFYGTYIRRYALQWGHVSKTVTHDDLFGMQTEPFMLHVANEGEIGKEWERHMFGCHINDTDDWKFKKPLAWRIGKKVGMVPMEWVWRWFQAETWERTARGFKHHMNGDPNIFPGMALMECKDCSDEEGELDDDEGDYEYDWGDGEEDGGDGEDYGGEDYGGEDYGGEDYGGEDYGGEDYGGEEDE